MFVHGPSPGLRPARTAPKRSHKINYSAIQITVAFTFNWLGRVLHRILHNGCQGPDTMILNLQGRKRLSIIVHTLPGGIFHDVMRMSHRLERQLQILTAQGVMPNYLLPIPYCWGCFLSMVSEVSCAPPFLFASSVTPGKTKVSSSRISLLAQS